MLAVALVTMLAFGGPGCGHGETAAPDSGQAPRQAAATATVATTKAPLASPTPSSPAIVPASSLRPGTRGPLRIEVDGGVAVVELLLDPPRFMASEPALARLTLSVEGDGVQAQLFSGPPDSLGRPPFYSVVFLTAGGRELLVPEDPSPMGGMNGMSGWRAASVGRPVHQRLLLPTYAAGLTPGPYVVHAETAVRARRGTTSAWREIPIAVELPVEVIADEPAAMGAVIDAIGARALDGDYDAAGDAAFQLRHVRDPRSLRWWLRIAQVPSYSRRITALWAIGKHDDAESVAALIRATRTAPEELGTTDSLDARRQSAQGLRHVAVHELAESMRPEALAALLEMRDSSDAEVRLTVVHRAARLPPPEARSHLERYREDRDDLVRSEARRYLRELPR